MAAVSFSYSRRFIMEGILSALESVNIDPSVFLSSTLILSVGSIVLGLIGRFAFGGNRIISHSVSSAISILFVYAVAIVVYSIAPSLIGLLPTLPYATIDTASLTLFSFSGAHYTVISSQVLSMIILAFLANLLDALIPNIKNFFGWFLTKAVTVVGAIGLQLLVDLLIRSFLPIDFITYAPVILVALMVLLLLVGALKIVVGALLATVNPLIAAFYTFFFATVVGKALTKAMLTTAIITGLVIALAYVGCTSISIAAAALIAYIPFLIILVAAWYLVNRISK